MIFHLRFESRLFRKNFPFCLYLHPSQYIVHQPRFPLESKVSYVLPYPDKCVFVRGIAKFCFQDNSYEQLRRGSIANKLTFPFIMLVRICITVILYNLYRNTNALGATNNDIIYSSFILQLTVYDALKIANRSQYRGDRYMLTFSIKRRFVNDPALVQIIPMFGLY